MMVKILFLNSNEIEVEMNKVAKVGQTYEVSVDENTSKDVLLVVEDKKIIDTLPIENVFPILEKVHGVGIKSYDVYEVGDFGDGFAFSIE
jgi:hypothetical protein